MRSIFDRERGLLVIHSTCPPLTIQSNFIMHPGGSLPLQKTSQSYFFPIRPETAFLPAWLTLTYQMVLARTSPGRKPPKCLVPKNSGLCLCGRNSLHPKVADPWGRAGVVTESSLIEFLDLFLVQCVLFQKKMKKQPMAREEFPLCSL